MPLNHQKFIKQYLLESEKIIKKMPLQDIEKAINILFEAWQNNATVFVMGNGGSSSTASHFAADLSKYTLGKKFEQKKRFKVICLTDNMVTMSAWTNDVGFETVFSEQMEPWIKTNDVVVAFSVHGGSGGPNEKKKWSQNIPKAFDLAKSKGAKLVGFSGDTGGYMKEVSDACIIVPTVNIEMITVHVEGFHVVLHHMIIHRLKELIEKWENLVLQLS